MSLTAAVSNFSNFPFTPLQLPGCIVWFDSADSNTYSGSGTTGFQWRSKGLNPLTASVNQTPGPAAATCNGYPCIYFSNSNTKLLTGTIPTLGAAGTTWFAAGFNNCNPQPADAAVLIASVSPEKAIRWSIAGNVLIYALDASPLGTQTASNNGVRGFIETTSLFSAYQNGTLSSNTTVATYQGGTNVSFVMGQWATSGLIGGINEVIVYNSPLSITQYQQVEGYLAWKYGYNAQLPATHPNFRATPPVAGQPTNFGQTVNQTVTRLEPLTQQNTSFWRAFSPTGLPNCVGWFDGKDPLGTGVVPAAGAAVSTWVDKSGQANNASSNSAALPFYNSNGYITFTGSNFLLLTNPNALVANSSFSIFVIEQRSNIQTSAQFNFWVGGSGNTGSNVNLQFGYRNSNVATLGFFFNDVDYASVPNPVANEPFRLWDGVWDGTNQYIYLNGSNVAQRVQAGNITSWENGTIGGYRGGTSNYYAGNIGEIIFFKPALNATNRQQVEGYLAYKWGIQSNLPTTHPVASNQSAILFSNVVIPLSKTIVMSGTNRWQPNAVTGLALWLDAADSAAVLTSNNSVTQWNDKSGNARNATATQANPTYVTNSLNGLPILRFSNPTLSYSVSYQTQFLTVPVFNPGTTTTRTIFAVANVSATRAFDSVARWGAILAWRGTHSGMFINELNSSQFLLNGAWWNNTNSVIVSAENNINSNVPLLLYNTFSISGSTATATNFVNATQTAVATASMTAFANSYTSLTIGCAVPYSVGNGYNWLYNGDIAEILVYQGDLTVSQRQLTEGYLAWKWGLRGSLPSNHPYKIIPPS